MKGTCFIIVAVLLVLSLGKECTMSAKDIESNYGKPGSESALTEIMHGSRIFYQERAKFPMGLYNELTETRLKHIKC